MFIREKSVSYDYSTLELYCQQQIGGPSEPKSIQITFIDGETKPINLNKARFRDIKTVELEKKGMPKMPW